MSTPALFAPWRMDYIRSLGGKKGPDNACFLCEAAAGGGGGGAPPPRDRLVLWQTEQTVVLLNRYPYANGHLLVAPRRHLAELEELTPAELADVAGQTVEVVRLLKSAVSAQGFNVGINLGRIAGAGVPGHLHQHVVPRWGGDTNFMHVVGEVSVVPEATSRLWTELMGERAKMGK
jgi:ATP adenylyltransferase